MTVTNLNITFYVNLHKSYLYQFNPAIPVEGILHFTMNSLELNRNEGDKAGLSCVYLLQFSSIFIIYYKKFDTVTKGITLLMTYKYKMNLF